MIDSSNHLDAEIILELQDIMEDDFGILLETYLSDAVLKMASIDAAAAAASLDKLRDSSHGFKGSSANIGAYRLSKICSDIEDLARNGHFEEAVKIIPEIQKEFDCVKQLLEQKF